MTAERSLISAILIQAIKDSRPNAPAPAKHRRSADSFLLSGACDELCGVIGLPLRVVRRELETNAGAVVARLNSMIGGCRDKLGTSRGAGDEYER